MRITIITAVRNGARTILNCLESVRRQTLPADHLVIDGQSTDGTLKILAQASHPRLSVTSEPDTGMYDAMGRGIARATGDIVGILNADDFLAGPHVLESVAEAFADATTDCSYGDLVYIEGNPGIGPFAGLEQKNGSFVLSDEQVVRRWRAGPMSARGFYWGWMPPHPTFFVRRSIYNQHGAYRLDLGTAADYELMLRFLVKHRIRTRYVREVLVKMLVGGASNASLRNRWRANRGDRKAWAVNGLRPYPWTLALKPLRKLGQWRGW